MNKTEEFPLVVPTICWGLYVESRSTS